MAIMYYKLFQMAAMLVTQLIVADHDVIILLPQSYATSIYKVFPIWNLQLCKASKTLHITTNKHMYNITVY